MMLTLSTGHISSGATANVASEAQGSEILRAPHCHGGAHTSAKRNLKLHLVLGELTAERSELITR